VRGQDQEGAADISADQIELDQKDPAYKMYQEMLGLIRDYSDVRT
jgi:hypothetical protein